MQLEGDSTSETYDTITLRHDGLWSRLLKVSLFISAEKNKLKIILEKLIIDLFHSRPNRETKHSKSYTFVLMLKNLEIDPIQPFEFDPSQLLRGT